MAQPETDEEKLKRETTEQADVKAKAVKEAADKKAADEKAIEEKKAKAEAEKNKKVEVNLDETMSINGARYEAGTHKVDADLAKDLERMNKDHNKYLADLNKNNKVNGNLGSRSAA